MKTHRPFLIIALYLLPILLWSGISLNFMPVQPGWLVLSSGLSFFVISASLLLYFTQENEKSAPEEKEPVEPTVIYKTSPVDERLKFEVEALKNEAELLKQESNQTLAAVQEVLQAKEKEIEQLKDSLKEESKKDSVILELSKKIEELNYEIETLVHLSHDEPLEFPPVPYHNEESAILLLKKWIDVASKFPAQGEWENPFLKSRSPTDLSRMGRLIEGEKEGAVFLYSPADEKPLFASPPYFDFWSTSPQEFSEKFHVKFPSKSLEWHDALEKTRQKKYALLNSLEPEKKSVLGIIPSGPFKDYLMGVSF